MDAVKKETIEESLAAVEAALPATKTAAERRELYALRALLQEQSGLFDKAFDSYIQAIAQDPGAANNNLRFSALVCALAYGNIDGAENQGSLILATAADMETAARARLLVIWVSLCRPGAVEQFTQLTNTLQSFLNLRNMDSVRPQVLLTLWWLTDDAKFASLLEAEFPKSPETAVTKGRAFVLPSPFWYFVPRIAVSKASPGAVTPAAAAQTGNVLRPSQTSGNPVPAAQSAAGTEKITRWQLGFFREEANAASLKNSLAAAGFTAEILRQPRPSGTVYFSVTVRETDGTMRDQLKNAGYESYPVFE